MAGNRLRFEEAIQKANDAVWAEEWNDAIQAYQEALTEFPDDTSALMGYAWALFNVEDWEAAFQVYRRLSDLMPADPGPYERMGEILEHQGEPQRAAEAYTMAAERYARQNLTTKRIAALEAAIRLQPGNDRVWLELRELYKSQGQDARAALATLWLAYLYQDRDRDRAISLCRDMQRSVPYDPRLGQAAILLQGGRRIPKPPSIEADQGTGPEATEDIELLEPDKEARTPVEIARQRALAELAESIFAEGQSELLPDTDLLVGKAVDAQARGDVDAAIRYYEQLLAAGVSTPPVHFNLGLLYKEKMLFDKAIGEFQASLEDPEYMLGTQFALGECYQAQGEFKEALKHFLEAVKAIDIATVQREHVDDLIRVYAGLTQSLVTTGEPERARQVSQALINFLGQRGWEDTVKKARERLDELARSGTVLSLAEIVSLPRSEEVLRSIGLSQIYQSKGKTYAALEELLHAISIAPHYLPLHYLFGTTLRDNDRIEQAVEKFRFVARTYEIRGQVLQALTIYQTILEISPLDIAVHRHVIDLLVQHGRIDDALAQYLQTADAYYRLAQPERALEVYREALRLAPRGTPSKSWKVRILHRIADLDVQRLDWTAAIRDYEEILRIAPEDEQAHLALFRLYSRTGRPHLGIGVLDRLIKRYLSQRKVSKVLTILEDLIESQPENIPVRARLAQLYLNLGNREKALTHLDVLGDLQLEAGQEEAAIKTLEAILALNPPNRDAYADLYRELAQREPPTQATTPAK